MFCPGVSAAALVELDQPATGVTMTVKLAAAASMGPVISACTDTGVAPAMVTASVVSTVTVDAVSRTREPAGMIVPPVPLTVMVPVESVACCLGVMPDSAASASR